MLETYKIMVIILYKNAGLALLKKIGNEKIYRIDKHAVLLVYVIGTTDEGFRPGLFPAGEVSHGCALFG